MKTRTALPAALALVLAAGATVPAVAAPKAKPKPKPITESYSLQLAPVPLPLAGSGLPFDGSNSCVDEELEGISIDTRTIKPTGAGTLVVDVTGFAGDWDITVMNGAGKVLGIGAGTITGDPSSLGTDRKEKAVIKLKRGSELRIAVCNFGGGPTADAKYTFTYA